MMYCLVDFHVSLMVSYLPKVIQSAMVEENPVLGYFTDCNGLGNHCMGLSAWLLQGEKNCVICPVSERNLGFLSVHAVTFADCFWQFSDWYGNEIC